MYKGAAPKASLTLLLRRPFTQAPPQNRFSREPATQDTSFLPNCSTKPLLCSTHPSNHLGREVQVIPPRNRPITNNRWLKFCCPGNQTSNTQVPKQSDPPSSSPSPPTFHFIEPLIRHLGQPTSCVLQAVSCQKSTVILPHPSQNVSSYSFLTTSLASNDLQLYDLADLYEMCPFSCLFPKPNFSPSPF